MISFKQFMAEFKTDKNYQPHKHEIVYVERETSPEAKQTKSDFYLAHIPSGHIYKWNHKTPPIVGQILNPSHHELFWSPNGEHE